MLGGLLGFYQEAVVTSGPQQSLGELIGYAMGSGFGVFAIAALFFAWTHRTRHLIPAAMTGIVAQFVNLLTHPPRSRREELQDEVNRFKDASAESLRDRPHPIRRFITSLRPRPVPSHFCIRPVHQHLGPSARFQNPAAPE